MMMATCRTAIHSLPMDSKTTNKYKVQTATVPNSCPGPQVDTPKEAARIKAHGGQLMSGGQRIISPSGRHSLNMARAFGDADYKTPHRIVSAVPDVRHVSLGCGPCGALILLVLTLFVMHGCALLRAVHLG